MDIAMSETITGGCMCGAVRYVAQGEPHAAGYCYCVDCRKASGSGFIPFLSYAAERVDISGPLRQVRSPSSRGTEAVRNRCETCGSLVFGGEQGASQHHTIYAGSLDDPAHFRPTIALFTRDRPYWAPAIAGMMEFETMPGPAPAK
jgi:hypothetical protein